MFLYPLYFKQLIEIRLGGFAYENKSLLIFILFFIYMNDPNLKSFKRKINHLLIVLYKFFLLLLYYY